MNAKALIDRIVRVREFSLILLLVVLFAGTGLVNSRFLGVNSLRDILLNTAILALLAVGQTLVVIARNIDLSVGSVLGLTAFVVGTLFADHHVPILVAVVIGVAIGALAGVVNGVLVALCRIPALVVTLGTLYVIRGIDYAIASGRQVNAADLPSAFLKIGTGRILGVPYLVIIALVVLAAAAWGLRNLRSGRELYAIGSNPDAARLAGIPVGRRVFVAFVITGALSGLAGVLWAARYGTVDATAGNGLELNVVAGVVVGGVAIFGGSGTVIGAALGTLLLSSISSALVVLKADSFWEQAINGTLLLVAISVDRLIALRTARALRRSASRGATTVEAAPPSPPGKPPTTDTDAVRSADTVRAATEATS
jgi:rhamnose transport system permease protein